MKKVKVTIAGLLTPIVLFATGCVSEARYASKSLEASQAQNQASAAQLQADRATTAATLATSQLQAVEATLNARVLDAESVNREIQNEYYRQSLELMRWQILTGARLHRVGPN